MLVLNSSLPLRSSGGICSIFVLRIDSVVGLGSYIKFFH